MFPEHFCKMNPNPKGLFCKLAIHVGCQLRTGTFVYEWIVGPWMAHAVLLRDPPEYGYFGSNAALASANYCVITYQGWYVHVNKVDIVS